MKKTDTRAFVPPLPLARPTASRTQAFRATALREVRRRPPTVVRPGMFVPHFSQRRTVSRGACICSSASRSRRRFPTAASAPPTPALPIARWPTCSIVAAPFGRPTAISTQQAVHFGTQTPAAYSQRGVRLIIMACRLDRCGAPRPTDRAFHAAGGAFRHADARGLFTAGRSAYYNGVLSRSLRHPSADRPRFPLSRRRPSARRRPRRVSPRQRGTHAPSFFPHMRRTGG